MYVKNRTSVTIKHVTYMHISFGTFLFKDVFATYFCFVS